MIASLIVMLYGLLSILIQVYRKKSKKCFKVAIQCHSMLTKSGCHKTAAFLMTVGMMVILVESCYTLISRKVRRV